MAHDRNWLLDHTGIGVSHIARSSRFDEAALKPLGVKVVARIAHDMSAVDCDGADIAGVGLKL